MKEEVVDDEEKDEEKKKARIADIKQYTTLQSYTWMNRWKVIELWSGKNYSLDDVKDDIKHGMERVVVCNGILVILR
ncbi:hypothetical protein E2C01_089060 [Portunus trituberculatus]|uniref:Uncharacterized protein n=1 Tax=Portunus trituberculatus TaxID=210409 RepID=A0A5B7JHR1_PORTR|nr:hypothetical protein [Portunus trituberculatus]